MLEVKSITKKYNVSKSPWKRIAYNLGFKSIVKESEFFFALQDVNFSINKGETVGIIGRNGSGKSTLLQIICGTLKPTEGNVVKPNKIAALLELGAGFNPEFTGLENIFLNGALIGMSRAQIQENLDGIIEFSELGDFVKKPVKTYSSGMFARLAFSIAVHSKPELLIVDEALSVGDMAFQEKSINKMKELRDLGIPIFFVSHSLPMVRNFCNRAIWMESGKVKMDGEAKIVCAEYYKDNLPKNASKFSHAIRLTPDNPKITIENISTDKKKYFSSENISLRINLKVHEEIQGELGIGIIVRDENENIISILSTVRDSIKVKQVPEKVTCNLLANPLPEGKYSLSVSITDELSTFHYDRIDYAIEFDISTPANEFGLPLFEGTHYFHHEWSIQ
ncbi:ABC transporter ATP-binding protein [Vibrio cholerae]|uniref:ABC transporter ATP-binding protein n=1 Tax=Vibrio cholerae TaxID=666 RepID=UPI00215BAE0A|nr:ABC transporter ATP-binding protein [Vibrio cholerae]MCR9700424.1 ABC transporter ATP-binding protein [Vibrio cholerae]